MNKIKTPWCKHYDGVREHLDYPKYSIFELLEESANKHPDYISYNYFGAKHTYIELIEQVKCCSEAFLQMGYKKGDVISICMPNTPEAVIGFYAANRIGAVANMIHPLSAENEIKQYVNGTDSRCIIVIDVAAQKINNILSETKLKDIILVSPSDSMPVFLKAGYKLTKDKTKKLDTSNMISWKNWMAKGKNLELLTITVNAKADDTAVILYSGGTSGTPKGIELTNMNFNALAIQGYEACACLSPKDTVLAIMPVFHGFGLGICIHTAQYFGGTCILLPTFNLKTFDTLLKKYKPNIIAGVPTLYEALLKNKNLDGVDLSFLKCVISGGDSLSVGLKQKIDAFLKEHGANTQIRECYGLTECVTGSCLTPLNEYREGSIGIPYPDMYYKIVKPETMEELPYGEEGEIVISGPTVMKGYLGCDDENAKVLKVHEDGARWLHTGDLGYMDEDGFVYFKQRLKRVIMSSGYCVYPQYIENVLDMHPDVLMSCVIGIKHEYKMEVPKAFIVLKDNAGDEKEIKKSIRKHCEENLAKYSWPAAYEFRKELPKTLVGKIACTQLEQEESENVR